jgi:hypothetical protein
MMVAYLAFAHGLESSATVASCGFCHVMTPFVEDLRNPQSVTLAARHFRTGTSRKTTATLATPTTG